MYLTDKIIEDNFIECNGSLSPVSKLLLSKLAERDGLSGQEFENYLEAKLEALYSKESLKSRIEVMKCNNCGGNAPLISKVCHFCATPFGEPENTEVSRKKILNDIDRSIVTLKSLPKQKFSKSSLEYWSAVVITYLIFFLIVQYAFRNYVIRIEIEDAKLWLIGWFTLVTLLKGYDAYDKRKLPSLNSKKYEAEFDKYSRLIRTFWNENPENWNSMQQLRDQIEIIKARSGRRIRNRIIRYSIVISFLIVLAILMNAIKDKGFMYFF